MTDGNTWDIAGKTVLVTGGNSGIGRVTALELARRGAHVTITARDAQKGARAVDELRAELAGGAGSLDWMLLDLADFQSILAFAKAFQATHEALHVLVHNAGLVLSERRETVDGFEATFGTNHMGPFILNRLLLDLVRASAPARIVVVASDAHKLARSGLDFDDLQTKHGYDGVPVYARSKLANILFTRELSRRLEGSGVTANCLHPGVVATGFTHDGDAGGLWGFIFKWMRPLLLTPEKGARTSVFLASAPEVSGVSGGYFVKQRLRKPSKAAADDAAALQLWEISDALTAGASLPAL
jgi:NAD(P)-dependent dehydrogenase (short-subunit alcohol dehydrogenase family)